MYEIFSESHLSPKEDYLKLMENYTFVDSNMEKKWFLSEEILRPEHIATMKDLVTVVITIYSLDGRKAMYEQLRSMGIPENKICYLDDLL